MPKDGIELFTELINEVMRKNSDLIDIPQLKLGMQRFKKSHPLIERIGIDDGFIIKHDLTDSAESYEVLSVVLDVVHKFLEIFSGKEEAAKRVIDAASEVFSKYKVGVQNTEVSEYIPSFIIEALTSGISDDDAREETLVLGLYQRLFEVCVRIANLNAKELYLAAAKYGFPSGFITVKNGKVTIAEKSMDLGAEVLKTNLARILDDVVYGLVPDENRIQITEELGRVLKEFGERPYELGIADGILGGAFARRVSTGLLLLDEIIGGGLPRNSNILLQGPLGFEKSLIAECFVRDCLEKRGGAFVFLTMMSPDEFRQDMASLSLDTREFEEDRSLKIVDWYSYKLRAVHGVEDDGVVVSSNDDLTNAGIAVDVALKTLAARPVKRAVIWLISNLVSSFDSETSFEFIKSLSAKLKNKGFTTIFVVEKDILSPEMLRILHDGFDGIIDIDTERDGPLIKRSIGVISMRDTFFDMHYLPIEMERNRLILKKDGEETSLSYNQTGFPKTSVGIENFYLLAEGVPRASSFVVQGPACVEKESFSRLFVKEGIQRGEAILLALSDVSPEEFHEQMALLGVDSKAHEDKGLLKIIDWYSFKAENIVGIEEEKNRIKCSQDLTNVGIAFDIFLRTFSGSSATGSSAAGKRAYVDIISPALKTFDFETVYRIVQFMTARLKNEGFTAYFNLEKEMHEAKVVSSFHEIFDGVMDIDITRDTEDIRAQMGILTLKNTFFSSVYRPIKLESKSLVVLEGKAAPTGPTVLAEPSMDGKVGPQTDTGETEKDMEIVSAGIDSAEREVMKKVLQKLDTLLEKLPEEVIEDFAHSEDFELYKKILKRYGI